MAHPFNDEAKRVREYRMRGMVGASAKIEHPSDKARRLAGLSGTVAEDRRVVGDPSPPDYVTKEQEG